MGKFLFRGLGTTLTLGLGVVGAVFSAKAAEPALPAHPESNCQVFDSSEGDGKKVEYCATPLGKATWFERQSPGAPRRKVAGGADFFAIAVSQIGADGAKTLLYKSSYAQRGPYLLRGNTEYGSRAGRNRPKVIFVGKDAKNPEQLVFGKSGFQGLPTKFKRTGLSRPVALAPANPDAPGVAPDGSDTPPEEPEPASPISAPAPLISGEVSVDIPLPPPAPRSQKDLIACLPEGSPPVDSARTQELQKIAIAASPVIASAPVSAQVGPIPFDSPLISGIQGIKTDPRDGKVAYALASIRNSENKSDVAILRSEDGGNTWSVEQLLDQAGRSKVFGKSMPNTPSLSGLEVSPDGALYLPTSEGLLIRDLEGKWTNQFSGKSVTAIRFAPNETGIPVVLGAAGDVYTLDQNPRTCSSTCAWKPSGLAAYVKELETSSSGMKSRDPQERWKARKRAQGMSEDQIDDILFEGKIYAPAGLSSRAGAIEIDPKNPNRFFVGTGNMVYSGLRQADGSVQWQLFDRGNSGAEPGHPVGDSAYEGLLLTVRKTAKGSMRSLIGVNCNQITATSNIDAPGVPMTVASGSYERSNPEGDGVHKLRSQSIVSRPGHPEQLVVASVGIVQYSGDGGLTWKTLVRDKKITYNGTLWREDGTVLVGIEGDSHLAGEAGHKKVGLVKLGLPPIH